MTVAGICRCKDEADIIASTVGHMLTQVDFVIVSDNASTDGTRDILADLDVAIIDDPEPGYYQSERMTALAHRAAGQGATWVVAFDADEWWYSPFGRVADVLEDLPAAIVTADLYDHVATGADPAEPDPTRRIGWRRVAPAPLPKVACRPRLDVRIHQGNHEASYGDPFRIDGQLVVRHFPYRSVEQFERKVRNGAAAYAATDLPDDVGAHWRGYGRILDEEGPEALASVFRRWFWRADPAMDPSLTFDPVQ